MHARPVSTLLHAQYRSASWTTWTWVSALVPVFLAARMLCITISHASVKNQVAEALRTHYNMAIVESKSLTSMQA